ncbi:unnamed protein product [Prorocentrum cordatum]|uniref:Uncharacterized protein n=1 Tax=Prorocentrum cordatum TaxID=2364126 RepID=A0ABN9S5U6_9DINO|nr:unnamed protein product [Polarella glacialis]
MAPRHARATLASALGPPPPAAYVGAIFARPIRNAANSLERRLNEVSGAINAGVEEAQESIEDIAIRIANLENQRAGQADALTAPRSDDAAMWGRVKSLEEQFSELRLSSMLQRENQSNTAGEAMLELATVVGELVGFGSVSAATSRVNAALSSLSAPAAVDVCSMGDFEDILFVLFASEADRDFAACLSLPWRAAPFAVATSFEGRLRVKGRDGASLDVRIVSHRRSAAFTNLVTNIVLDATGWTSEDLAQAAFGQYSMKRVSDQPLAECCLQAEGLLRTLPSDVLDRSYWICLFAVDIHRADCGDCPRCRATEAWKRDPVAHLRASSCLSCGTAKRLPCPSAASAETPKVAFDRPDCEVNKFGAIAKRMDSVMLSLDPSLSALRSPRVVAEVSTALRLWPVHFRLAFALRQDGLDWLRGHAEELVPSLEQGEVQRPPPRQAQPAGGLASPHPAAGAGDKLVSCIAGLKSPGRPPRVRRGEERGPRGFGGGMRAAELPDDARRDLEKVKHLEMDFTWLGTGLKSISDSLCDTTALDALQLESLQVVLDRCKEVHDLGTLGEALRRQAELRSLDASFRFCYKLGDSALACFAAGLPTSLTDLDLNFCFCVRVGNEGLTALAQQLPGSLRRLQLNFASCDGLTDSGVASLAKRLPPDLRSLDLTFSWIGDGGMSALAAGMPAALEELEIKCSLGNVNLTDRGLAALASRLPDGLQKINLTLAHTGASMAAQALGSSVQGLRDWRSKAQPAEPALAWPDGAAAFRLVDDDPSLDATHVVAKRAVAF